MIRYATLDDIPAIEAIARQHPQELGFVRRNSLERGIKARELYVADSGGAIVGFVNWHARRDGWNTVYELGVAQDAQGQGIGRLLLYSVPCPLRLKCTSDNPANDFYQGAGMTHVATEKGRKRALNVYEMRVLNVIVRGSAKEVPAICRTSGSAYGSAETETPQAPLFMADVNFISPNWERYMTFICRYRPVQALTVDYFAPEQKQDMLSQVADLQAAGVLRVVVCAKFHGAVADIPHDCIVGVSLRTNGKLSGAGKFAGFMPDFAELAGRKCHLLGGSPTLQKDTLAKLRGVGAVVVSVDGNAQFGAAARGSSYSEGLWQRRGKARYEALATHSSIHIQRELNAVTLTQPKLF